MSERERIRVMIVDDHRVVRAGLRFSLLAFDDLELFGELNAYPDVRVLVLTGFDTTTLIRESLDAGATGYLLKNLGIDELADAIRAACDGQLTLAPEAIRALAEASPQ